MSKKQENAAVPESKNGLTSSRNSPTPAYKPPVPPKPSTTKPKEWFIHSFFVKLTI